MEQRLPFRTLLYRYLFFAWLFRDARSGDRTQRLLAVHHNRKQVVWLPAYMKRWGLWALCFYGVGAWMEPIASAGAAKTLYALSALCVAVVVAAAINWVALTHEPELI